MVAHEEERARAFAARARRRGLEIDMEEHLAALDKTGAGDEAVAARARAELPDVQYAAFQQGQTQARKRHATRAEYAFMTPKEIDADIAAKAPGGGPRDGDERDAAHATRTAIRDEVLAAPADRPALIVDLRDRYGAQAGMLAAELTGEVDANTALLIAHADMLHLPRMLAQGME